MNRRGGTAARWAAGLVLAAALAGCSSAPKAIKATTTTTRAAPSTTSTSPAAAVSTTLGGTTSTSASVTTTPLVGSTTTTTAAPKTVTATQADNGRRLTLHVGDTLQVVLTGCGGCGYEWEMTGQPSSAVFQYEGETNSSASTTTTTVGQPAMVGTPVTYTWTFKALSAHTTGFVAGYFPPSQKAPTQTYSLGLTVIKG
jgi:predicted secreted protein